MPSPSLYKSNKTSRTCRTHRTKTAIALSSLILFGLASCSAKVSQCNALISTINGAQGFRSEYEQAMGQSLEQISSAQNLAETKSAAGQYVAAVESASASTSQLLQALGNLNLADEQLVEYRNRYSAVITQWTTALTSAKEAMQLLATADTENAFRDDFDQFQKQTNSAYSTIQATDAEESSLIEGINAYCDSAAR